MRRRGGEEITVASAHATPRPAFWHKIGTAALADGGEGDHCSPAALLVSSDRDSASGTGSGGGRPLTVVAAAAQAAAEKRVS